VWTGEAPSDAVDTGARTYGETGAAWIQDFVQGFSIGDWRQVFVRAAAGSICDFGGRVD